MNSRLGVTATTDMAVLPGVLGCRTLRGTNQVRNPIPRYRRTVARWQAHLGDLVTVIEAPCPALAGLKRDSKCKEEIPFYCSSLANPAARLVDELKSSRYGECAR